MTYLGLLYQCELQRLEASPSLVACYSTAHVHVDGEGRGYIDEWIELNELMTQEEILSEGVT
jgi:hypothetical protein